MSEVWTEAENSTQPRDGRTIVEIEKEKKRRRLERKNYL